MFGLVGNVGQIFTDSIGNALYISSDTSENVPIQFVTGQKARVTIQGDGNVGIGTTTPARKLHINGVLRLEPTSEPSDPAEGDIYMDSGTHKLRVYDGSNWHDLW
ncbi:MAG: hypothetical protein DSZ06_03040 [Sulfurospirillum sp.]|nr:MAG: hypothetical protein DSZ06_03040 [Sulfurospirillum sp.]